ncbi:GAF domain-containing SpoIIE family protein phosphatase [Pseudonocardia parietis]|uniref:GAF domain-containing protein n=1 Tax=Pseudonocardia parietis TaxID=570936 RepID=A0ABS4W0G2_9PSEU|nr:SpoIIE family protein phosphatase [Pseudonocardia parietis]MBP2369689.1 GAF domain-containing protein [Pseudonocardia parietis]
MTERTVARVVERRCPPGVPDVVRRNPERLRALERAGLGAEPDAELEFFADWLRRALGAGGAAVSLVQGDRLVVPGAAGLPEPVASTRSAALANSPCRHVVETAEPVIVPDTRDDPRWAGAPAGPGGAAYIGMPLTDRAGNVLGSLCALDGAPRRWSNAEIETMTGIARACSTELRLRLAEHDAGREVNRRDEFEAGQQRAFDRSQTLLTASQAFTDTVTVVDVHTQITDLLTAALAPAHLDVAILDGRDRLRPWERTSAVPGPAAVFSTGSPAALVLEQHRILHYPDRAAFDHAHPGGAGDQLRELGLHCVVVAPLPSDDRIVGAVVLGWPVPDAIEPADLLTITTLAGYAGQALGRAHRLLHRTGVAREMQEAMLATLPTVADLPMAARYAPADSRESVGGDWYEAAELTDPAHPDEDVLLLSVGDIIGHSLRAVTLMGQTRSMLRQAASDHAGGPPSVILESFEAADAAFGLGAAGTAIIAELRRSPERVWSMTWTNAGHPPPILLGPDGTGELLDAHDVLFGFGLAGPGERVDHRREIPPGSVLFLYTDGLVERRDSDIDAGTGRLLRLLESVHDHTPQDIVDTVVDTLARDARDDVVAFAVRIP